MTTAPKYGTTRSCFEWAFAGADLQAAGREGQCRKGRNGQEHLASCRGTGPSIQGRTRRDNVGKGHLPAGTGNNLQRPHPIRREPKWAGRDLVWRMSPYERRREGNASPERGKRARSAGNASVAQRGSGHLAVPGGARAQIRDNSSPRSGDEPTSKPTTRGVYVDQRLSLLVGGKAGRESQGQNRTREIRPSGIVGGPGET